MIRNITEEEFLSTLCSTGWDRPIIPEEWIENCKQFLRSNRVSVQFAIVKPGKSVFFGVVNDKPITSIGLTYLVSEDGRGTHELSRKCNKCHPEISYRCQHVMATLFYLVHVKSKTSAGADFSYQWDSLLRSIEKQETRASILSQNFEGSDKEFGLVFYASDDGLHEDVNELLVTPVLSGRTKKNERTAKGLINLSMNEQGIVQTPKGGWDENLKIQVNRLMLPRLSQELNRLRYGREGRYETALPIASNDQLEALIEIARRVPVSFSDIKNEYNWIGETDVKFEWEQRKDGNQVLNYRVGGPEMASSRIVYLKALNRCFFFDLSLKSFGILSTNAATMSAVLAMPPLPPNLNDSIRKRLASQQSVLQLPLPEAAFPIEDIRVKPSVYAVIHQGETSRTINLKFSYFGHRIPANTVGYHTVNQDGKTFHLFQDLAGEQQIRETLSRRLSIEWSHDTGYFTVSNFRSSPIEEKSFFLARVIPVLIDMGIQYELPEGHQFIAIAEPSDIIADIDAEGNNWLRIGIGFDLDGQRIDLLPVLKNLLETNRLDLSDDAPVTPDEKFYIDIGSGHFAPVKVEKLRSLVKPIVDLLKQEKIGTDGKLKIRATAFAEFEDISASGNVMWRAASQAQKILDRIKNRFSERDLPETFKGELRKYQKTGFDWLGFLSDLGLGGLLADDMGLGKTIQIIAHICSEKAIGRLTGPALIVLPQNLLDQWGNRFSQFAPHLSLMTWYGGKRKKIADQIKKFDIVMTTYKLVYLDIDILKNESFPLMVMDETKNIKNPNSLFNKAQKHLNVERRIAIGGTPLENNVDEYWSCFDAVESGILGSLKDFRTVYGNPISKNGDAQALEHLRKRMAPLWLRRKKEDVLTELPPKTIEAVYCPFSKAQADMYEAIRAVSSNEIMEILQEKGIARSKNSVLSKLVRLRMACDSMALIDRKAEYFEYSSKEQWLLDNVPVMVEEGRKIIVFSFFETMISRIEKIMVEEKILYSKMTGKVSRSAKSQAEKDFKEGKTSVFLITLTSGGAGLDLPEGDTVIQVEPQFNPQTENQGNDRVHRIGQKKNVMVYRLIVPGTLEEQILGLQKRKIDLGKAMFDGGDFTPETLTEDDIRALLSPISRSSIESDDGSQID